MSSFAPATLVEGVQRQPLPYGLFSVLTPRPEGDSRWLNGVEWETLSCDPASGRSGPSCEDVADDQGNYPNTVFGLPKNLDRNVGGTGEAAAFAVYGHFNCSPVGFTPELAQERASAHLMAREQARVEQALWTGDLGNFPNMSDGVDVLTGSPLSSAAEALALLEDYIAQTYGSLGVIHGSRGAVTILSTPGGNVQATSTRLTTTLGTPIVAGAGYPNSDTAGAVAAQGTFWLRATPALFGYRSEILTSSATPGDLLDRSTNDLYAIAERGYLLGWDPCGVAAVAFTA